MDDLHYFKRLVEESEEILPPKSEEELQDEADAASDRRQAKLDHVEKMVAHVLQQCGIRPKDEGHWFYYDGDEMDRECTIVLDEDNEISDIALLLQSGLASGDVFQLTTFGDNPAIIFNVRPEIDTATIS